MSICSFPSQECDGRSTMRPVEIEEFELHGVTPTGKILGGGSYGSVVEVKYCHVLCAAKKLHKDLLSPEDDGFVNVIDKYIEECRLMSRLRHPNLTQFLGVCFLSSQQAVPHLVMEKLETSLHSLLETVPCLSLSIRVAWLKDVCHGLSFLHGRSPAVIHRDLTACNVLLTSSLLAKISDVGNSRILESPTGQLPRTFTRQPGTLVYMPPEAVSEIHRYGPQLDIFSYGHLTLFTLIQEFPCDLKSATYTDPEDSTVIKGRSEIERREDYMVQVNEKLQASYPSLPGLVIDCLQNNPEVRPSLEEILEVLMSVKKEIEHLHGREKVDVNGIFMQKKITVLEQAVLSLKMRAEEQQSLLNEKDDIISQSKEELKKKSQELSKTSSQLKTNLKLLQLKEDELQLKNDQLTTALGELTLKEVELQRLLLEESLEVMQSSMELSEQKLRERIQKSSEELNKCKKLLRIAKGVEGGDEPLDIDWRVGPAMPIPMAGYIQSVVLGDEIFVGGGFTNAGHRSDYEIMVYDNQSQRWQQSLTYSFTHFSLTIIHHQLAIVGGNNGESPTGMLGVWDADKKVWMNPYNPLPTPRFNATVAVYNDWLIVAGGSNVVQKSPQGRHQHRRGSFRGMLSVCEVLSISENQWHTSAAMPLSWTVMKSVVVDDVLYVMGGHVEDGVPSNSIYSAPLEGLVRPPSPEETTPQVWKKMDIDCSVFSVPANINGFLHVCGGLGSRSIRRYIPQTEEWLLVGELPQAFHKSSVTMTANGELFVAGGCASLHRPLNLLHLGHLHTSAK